MKIGFLVTLVANVRGFENVVSAHVQLPSYTMQLLRKVGHEVQLITTEFGDDCTLPNCLPKDIPIHQVVDGRRRGNGVPMEVGHRHGIRLLRFVKQLLQIKQISEEQQYDILHLFGSNRMAHLAGLLHLIGVKIPITVTLVSGRFPERLHFFTQYLWQRVHLVVTSTEFLQRQCHAHAIPAKVIRHGVNRNFQNELDEISVAAPHRVLFWRDLSKENGADVCLQVFQSLAPRFPDISFDLAVRPHPRPVPGIKELCDKYPNVNLYQCPYANGISLAKLITESICVLLPFRKLSAHPQYAVVESLLANRVVITTALDSNLELIEPGRNGFLVPVGDVRATIETVERVLADRQAAVRIGRQAALDIKAKWNWVTYTHALTEEYSCLLR